MAAPTAAWLAAALARAKRSTLPVALGTLFQGGDDTGDLDAEAFDVATAIDAVEAALLTVAGTPTEDVLREALRPLAEPRADELGLPWETIADAILAALEGPPVTPTHASLDGWRRR